MTFSNQAKENKLIAIMDDFNIDLLKYDNHTPINGFINMIFSYHCQPSILHPTRITDSFSTIIDNIYVNDATESNIFAGNILSLFSDHLPQFAILSEKAPEYKLHLILHTRPLMKINFLHIIKKWIPPFLMMKVRTRVENLTP